MNILRTELDFFDVVKQTNPKAIVFTSNGVVNKEQELVMGGGIALAFKNKYPWLPFYIGNDIMGDKGKVKKYGVYGPVDDGNGRAIFALQTKVHYKDPSEFDFVIDNTKLLFEKTKKYSSILMVAPGIGLGGLDEVKVLAAIGQFLDKRFIVICQEKQKAQ